MTSARTTLRSILYQATQLMAAPDNQLEELADSLAAVDNQLAEVVTEHEEAIADLHRAALMGDGS